MTYEVGEPVEDEQLYLVYGGAIAAPFEQEKNKVGKRKKVSEQRVSLHWFLGWLVLYFIDGVGKTSPVFRSGRLSVVLLPLGLLHHSLRSLLSLSDTSRFITKLKRDVNANDLTSRIRSPILSKL